MTREELLKMIPEGYEECKGDIAEFSIAEYGNACVFFRRKPKPEPRRLEGEWEILFNDDGVGIGGGSLYYHLRYEFGDLKNTKFRVKVEAVEVLD